MKHEAHKWQHVIESRAVNWNKQRCRKCGAERVCLFRYGYPKIETWEKASHSCREVQS
jgi:hypothetical protein